MKWIDRILAYSDILPAEDGFLTRRIICWHRDHPHEQFVTHMECMADDGNWFRVHGHYYAKMDDALRDFAKRTQHLLEN